MSTTRSGERTDLGRFDSGVAEARAHFVAGDIARAVECWKALLQQQPDNIEVILGALQSLRVGRRLAEALELANESITKFPTDERVRIEYAQASLDSGFIDKANETAAWLMAEYPERPDGYAIAVISLRRLNKYGEADVLAQSALTRFASSVRLLAEYCRIPEYSGNWSIAVRRWEAFRASFPLSAEGYVGGAGALLRTEQLLDAEALISEAIGKFPRDAKVLIQWSTVAMRRLDWREAARRWKLASDIHPNNAEIRSGTSELNYVTQMESLAPLAPAVGTTEVSDDGFYSEFESMGNNCEFGLVQRLHNAEPLGLLRWARISIDKLISLLDNDFEGIGEIKNTRLEVSSVTNEFVLFDDRYLEMHTFIRRGSVDPDKLLAQMCRRLDYLKRKLIEDLQLGEKIFVCKIRTVPLSRANIRGLHKAIRRYGPGRLLCVGVPELLEQDARVDVVEDGLFAGYVSQLGPDPHAVRNYLPAWDKICRRAYQLAQG